MGLPVRGALGLCVGFPPHPSVPLPTLQGFPSIFHTGHFPLARTFSQKQSLQIVRSVTGHPL